MGCPRQQLTELDHDTVNESKITSVSISTPEVAFAYLRRNQPRTAKYADNPAIRDVELLDLHLLCSRFGAKQVDVDVRGVAGPASGITVDKCRLGESFVFKDGIPEMSVALMEISTTWAEPMEPIASAAMIVWGLYVGRKRCNRSAVQ